VRLASAVSETPTPILLDALALAGEGASEIKLGRGPRNDPATAVLDGVQSGDQIERNPAQLMGNAVGLGGGWLERDVVAEGFEPGDEALGGAFGVAADWWSLGISPHERVDRCG
jgi:hypothetical protein